VLSGLTKIYPKKKRRHSEDSHDSAVNNLNLTVDDGQFVVLVGPSGCGKSTTLRMIAGLEEPTSGEIYIGGKLMNGIPPKDRNVAMVFQDFGLYPHMTARENIELPLRALHLGKDKISKKVSEAADRLGITDYLDQLPGALSGGQQQRVAIGRAIVRNPDILLMDEPLSSLDAKLRVQLRSEIAELHRKLGTTIIYVTHDQTEAMILGDVLVVMNEGSMQQTGAPREIFDDPSNLFVAGFMGVPSINTLDVTVLSTGPESIRLRTAGGDIEVRCPAPEGLSEGVSAVLGVRPDSVAVSGDSANVLQGTVSEVEILGASANVTFSSCGTSITSVMSTEKFDLSGLSTGSRAGLSLMPQKLLLFDKATGDRIR
jgi:multiple sugar transport system ATP-binding protein